MSSPVVGIDIHPTKPGQVTELQRSLLPQRVPVVASAILLVYDADHPDIIGLHDQRLDVCVCNLGGHCRIHGLVNTLPRIIRRFFLRIREHRVRNTDGRKLHSTRAAIRVLIRMELQRQLLVRSLDLGIRSPGRDPQHLVMILISLGSVGRSLAKVEQHTHETQPHQRIVQRSQILRGCLLRFVDAGALLPRARGLILLLPLVPSKGIQHHSNEQGIQQPLLDPLFSGLLVLLTKQLEILLTARPLFLGLLGLGLLHNLSLILRLGLLFRRFRCHGCLVASSRTT
mmetsp:Transcript_2494/g.5714  ORF Transcript_2494/g.5714 Transcript_2494/m.5714 type:complete len:285 (-) Transcript_2494:8-862(-)